MTLDCSVAEEDPVSEEAIKSACARVEEIIEASIRSVEDGIRGLNLKDFKAGPRDL